MYKIIISYFVFASLFICSSNLAAGTVEEHYYDRSNTLLSNSPVKDSQMEGTDASNDFASDPNKLDAFYNGSESITKPAQSWGSYGYSLVKKGVDYFLLTLGNLSFRLTQAMVDVIRPFINLVGEKYFLSFIDSLTATGVKLSAIALTAIVKELARAGSEFVLGQNLDREVERLMVGSLKPFITYLSATSMTKLRSILRKAIQMQAI